MSGTEYLTYRGDTTSGTDSYIPSEADMGGTAKENDAKYVPNPSDPDAREWNQMVGVIAALARVSPVARIDVRFASGTPSVFAIYACNDEIEAADVTVTDVGTGVVKLAIPRAKITDPRWGRLDVQETGNFGGTARRSAANELTCEIFDSDSGSAADKNFVVEWG